MVGCADLEAPTSHKRGLRAFTAADPGGAYVHCGVREHVMGSMANGMAAHGGVIPLSVTYLAFSDYERPAMRMAALMDVLKDDKALKSIYLIGQDYSFGQAVAREAKRQLSQWRPDVQVVGDELHAMGRIKDFLPYA
eukprot:gene45272-biopygen36544